VLGKTSRATGVYKHINEACEGSFNDTICQNRHCATAWQAGISKFIKIPAAAEDDILRLKFKKFNFF
jgi:hypothetical protein